MTPRSLALLVALGIGFTGCYDDSAFNALGAGDSSSTTAANPTASVTASSGGISTVTSDGSSSSGETMGEGTSQGSTSSDSDPGGSSDSAADTPPTVTLEVTPSALMSAGFIDLVVEHSGDVVLLELWDATDDEKPQLTWAPSSPTPSYLLTRGQGETRLLTIRAYDSEGEVGVSNVATVDLFLPDPGTVLWETEIELADVTQGRAIAASFHAGDVRVFSGFDADNAARVGRYSSSGEAQLHAPVAPPLSTTTGVAMTPDGHILAVGVDLVDGKNRAWFARINSIDADVELLYQGKLGDAATGIAYDPVADRVYVSGYAPRPGHTAADAKIWALNSDGTPLWVRSWERPVENPQEEGDPADKAFAVAVLENGDPALVGESIHTPSKMGAKTELWAFVHRLTPGGDLENEGKSWVSDGAVNFAGAYAVAPDVDNGLLVAGWSSPDVSSLRQATVFAFDALLTEAEIHHHGGSGERVIKGVARVATGEIVYATDVDIEDEGRHDFEVRAIDAFFGPPAWEQVLKGPEVARAGALAISPEGHILVIGTLGGGGSSSMLITDIHP